MSRVREKPKTENVPRIRTSPVVMVAIEAGLAMTNQVQRIEKAGERAVGVADIHVLAAGLRLHGAQFRIGERAKEREHAADHPCQVDQFGRADRLHHFSRNRKSAADDGSNDDCAGMAHAEIASQFGIGTVSLGRRQVGEYTVSQTDTRHAMTREHQP